MSWMGEAWRRCSNLLFIHKVHREKHSKQLLPKSAISQCKADLLFQQEIPSAPLLLCSSSH